MARHVMIIDLSNDSVSGLLLDPTYDTQKKIFCSPTRAVTRVPLPFQSELNLERFLNQVVAALKTVIDALTRDETSRPAQVVCFLSAPFYASQTRVVRHTADQPFRITASFLNGLIAADLAQFTKQQPQLYTEVLADAHRVIESKTMQVKLNRYPTHTPADKQASEVEMYHYVSIGSERILGRFHEVIRGFVHHAPIEFHSFPFALFSIYRDYFHDRRYRFLVDVGAELTEVLLMAEDILWESVSFPAGYNGLIRELTRELGTVPEEAMSAFRLYRRSGENKLATAKMASALTSFQKIWVGYFRQMLETLSEEHLVPLEILAIGDPLVTPLLLDWLKEDKYNEILVGNRPFNPTLLSAATLAGQCGLPGTFPIAGNEHLLVGSVFYDKLLSVNQHG
ncbi:MAG: hypothetical protein AAB415_01135 [Patescibacteria group bacterium]